MEVPRPAWREHPGNGPYLLLIHGFLSSSSQWLENLEMLGRVCRPVTLDLWGHGASAAPPDAHAYLPAGYLQAVEAIRVELGAEHWFLCGYSLGAGITIHYALDYPDRVLGHVFTNSTSALADADQIAAWRSNVDATAEHIETGGRDAIEAIPVHPRRATGLPKAVYQALVADADKLDPLGVANTLRYTNPNISIRARVHENTVPALLACGARERRFEPHRAYLAANMPALDIVDLDAGHAVNMEAADTFNNAVTAFIEAQA